MDAVELCLAGRMESDTVRLTYRGGVRGVSMLAQMLEEQGVSVRYAPPRETRDMTEAAAIVVVVLSATGNIHDIAVAVQRFRQKFGSNAQIEGLPEPKQSVGERLAAVDQLLADGTITPEEHAQQKNPNTERALGERRDRRFSCHAGAFASRRETLKVLHWRPSLLAGNRGRA